MARETCPTCKRPGTITTTRESGGFRVQYYGCRQCGNYSLGSDVTAIPNAVSSTKQNNSR